MSIKVGDTIQITDGTSDDGVIIIVNEVNDNVIWGRTIKKNRLSLTSNLPSCYKKVIANREKLRTFLKENKVKATAVSVYLGKASSYLTTMASDKEMKRRGDISDNTFNKIMIMLSIDWESNKAIHVKQKGFVPYITRPCNYKTDQHKVELMRIFYKGCFVK